MGQIQWTVSLVMIALFAIAIIGFAINFAEDNNSPVDIADDTEINTLYTDNQDELSDLKTGSEETYQSIVESSIEEGGQTTGTGGSFAITPPSIIAAAKNVLLIGYTKIFGSGDGFGIFITTFLTMIAFITGLLLWKTWAGRIPD